MVVLAALLGAVCWKGQVCQEKFGRRRLGPNTGLSAELPGRGLRHTGTTLIAEDHLMRDSNVEPGTFQLILDQLEELIVTLIEEIRERPGVALAVLAAVLGALIGSALAGRAARRGLQPPARAARRARSLGAASELMGLGMRLMQNPIVRGLVFAAVQRQLRRRLRL
jgi:hypothetical protein